MVEEDVDANGPLKKRKLSTQVMEVARKKRSHRGEDLKWHSAGNSSGIAASSTSFRWWKASEIHTWMMPAAKKHGTASTGQQQLHLTPWFLQQYHLNQPTDENIPQGLIERKDAKYRWASYSRIAPQLHSHVRSPQGQMIAPPFGIQLIDSFRKWRALHIPLNKIEYHQSHLCMIVSPACGPQPEFTSWKSVFFWKMRVS